MKPKSIVFWGVLVCVAIALWVTARSGNRPAPATYSQFLQQVQNGEVSGVSIAPGGSGTAEAAYQRKDGTTLRTVLPADYRDALAVMRDKLVNIEIRELSPWFVLFRNSAPFLLLLLLWIILLFRLRRQPKPRGLI